jgi:hypothetical protein
MCQRNGLTPGHDIGSLRHPATTHDQGGNIDIAYYQTVADNHVRTVCDAAGGSHDGYYCAASAARTHIVDLPRTVTFIAALLRSPRVRAIGVDRVLGPLLHAEAARLRARGAITQADYDELVSPARLTWGDGWPFHHHHMHLSLDWL